MYETKHQRIISIPSHPDSISIHLRFASYSLLSIPFIYKKCYMKMLINDEMLMQYSFRCWCMYEYRQPTTATFDSNIQNRILWLLMKSFRKATTKARNFHSTHLSIDKVIFALNCQYLMTSLICAQARETKYAFILLLLFFFLFIHLLYMCISFLLVAIIYNIFILFHIRWI